MKTLMKISPVLIAFAVLIPFYGSNANAATVIYREVFGAASANNFALSGVGWSAAMGSAATDYSSTVNTSSGAFVSGIPEIPRILIMSMLVELRRAPLSELSAWL